MAAQTFDTPPSGFTRTKKGWLISPRTKPNKELVKITEENRQLRELLANLNERVYQLEQQGGTE